MSTLVVGLAGRSYPIHIGAGVLANAGELLAPLGIGRAVIVSNPVVARFHLDALASSLRAHRVPFEVELVEDGETHKDLRTLEDLLSRLLARNVERSTTLIALGGGVTGDLAGFAAAIYQRGIPFVQVPTTLLAQVDSSVGGKTGVNHPLGKNMIGAFYQPRAVLIDTDCLRTLPDREYRAGLAEVIKYGAIRDVGFFAWLEANFDPLLARESDAVAHAIRESCRNKAEVVEADERESGLRAILNFGHTFAHAIEAATGYGEWLHGEAVGTGMLLAARLSERVSGLPADDSRRLQALVARAKLPAKPPPIAIARWLELMQRDKKSVAGAIRFVLLETLGRASAGRVAPRETLAEILEDAALS
jgi:3-dehydroquinate synthase